MNFIKRLPVIFHLYLEIPFMSIRTSLFTYTWENNYYELIMLYIKIFKWYGRIGLSIRPEYLKFRKKQKEKECLK